ncbi:hypothetical protein GOBAR_AA16273 [Gossypium barbadense]|uniref:RRM domain-containing protein n=1 Tax=Gossypium barbadense TaxID=3634 RepID=A0A2P5XM57_GOSBA|nr:hypothetical protein GOBAR_AA16273 [Gossypium barbadense]
MDFDEYEYLEKTVEEQEDSKKKTKDGGGVGDKNERSYRKRDSERDEEDDEGKSSSKKSRSGREEEDEERRDRDKDRLGRGGTRVSASERRSGTENVTLTSETAGDLKIRRKQQSLKLILRGTREPFLLIMPLKATERDVYEFFSKAGKVRDVRLIMDRNSRRSKGVGYIEFYDVMSVPMAIALSGQLLLGQPVMVKPSEAEKNLVQSNTSGAGTGGVAGPYGVVDRKLYVGNLHFNMTEMQLRQIFEPFGPVELVQLPLDLETGQCKGFGFVQFAQLEHAKAAQSALNGKLEIAGRTIKVSSVTDHVVTQDTAAKSADFDDDEGGGLALNAQSRALLMRKLDRSGIATSITGSLGAPLLNGSAPNPQAVTLPVNGQAAYPTPILPPIKSTTALDSVGQPSECLLLKNMFDPATETEPDFDLDIKEDVEEECSKYGRVKHIYVDKNSAGCVYLRFDSAEAAGKAQRAMHMRWFAGRSISALFMQPQEYEARFKC